VTVVINVVDAREVNTKRHLGIDDDERVERQRLVIGEMQRTDVSTVNVSTRTFVATARDKSGVSGTRSDI
jgi:hypothetical protein